MQTKSSHLTKVFSGRYLLSMSGSPYKMILRSETLESLSHHMPVKAAPDLSAQLATPMPGKLHSVAVKGACESSVFVWVF